MFEHASFSEQSRAALVVTAAVAAGLTSASCAAPTFSSASAAPAVQSASEASGHGPQGSVALVLGRQEMEDELAWEGLDNPGAFGMQAWFALDDEGIVAIETGIGIAYDSVEVLGVDVDATFVDLGLGLRLSWPIGEPGGFQLRPYVAGGGLVGSAEVTGSTGGFSVSDAEGSGAYYLRAGVAFPISSRVELGADYRIVRGSDITLAGVETDFDSNRFGVFLGFTF